MAGRGTDIKLGGNLDVRLRKELANIHDEAATSRARGADPRGNRRRPPEGEGRRRAVRHRHRTPRKPAHRQPVARPLRPAGRSGPLALLPVAGRRPDAHLRVRPDGRDAAAPRAEGRRGDRPSLDQQGPGKGAEKGRGPQLRHPQERAEIRRRHERPAQGGLCPAQGVHEADGRRRHRRRHARRRSGADGRRPGAGEGVRGAVATRGTGRRRAARLQRWTCRSRNGARKTASTRRICGSASRRPWTK